MVSVDPSLSTVSRSNGSTSTIVQTCVTPYCNTQIKGLHVKCNPLIINE